MTPIAYHFSLSFSEHHRPTMARIFAQAGRPTFRWRLWRGGRAGGGGGAFHRRRCVGEHEVEAWSSPTRLTTEFGDDVKCVAACYDRTNSATEARPYTTANTTSSMHSRHYGVVDRPVKLYWVLLAAHFHKQETAVMPVKCFNL